MLCTNEFDRVAFGFLGPADPSTENGPKQFEWQRNTRRSRLGHVCSKCSANTWLLTRLRDVWFIVKGARYNGLHAHLVPLLHRQASARAGTGWHSENVQLNWRQWFWHRRKCLKSWTTCSPTRTDRAPRRTWPTSNIWNVASKKHCACIPVYRPSWDAWLKMFKPVTSFIILSWSGRQVTYTKYSI